MLTECGTYDTNPECLQVNSLFTMVIAHSIASDRQAEKINQNQDTEFCIHGKDGKIQSKTATATIHIRRRADTVY